MIQRLPELALMAGSILSFLAAPHPPPHRILGSKTQKNPWSFRRTLAGRAFPSCQSFWHFEKELGHALYPKGTSHE